MTISNYQTATQLLADIDKLESDKERTETNVVLTAEGSPLNEYIDFQTAVIDVILNEIDSQIAIKQAAFEAL